MNARIHALAQAAALAVLLVAGLVLVAGRAGRWGGPATAPAARWPVATVVDSRASLAPPPMEPASEPDGARGPAPDSFATGPGAAPTAPPTPPTPRPTPPPTPRPGPIGIIPGHWRLDSGAVCPDGLREVDVTTDVALRVRALLEYRGFRVDLLPEQNPRAPSAPVLGYRAAALVSIHADSCDVPHASGFKVARGRFSTTPHEDDRLVRCLEREFAAATLLPRHDDSITPDMWNYYAFRAIDGATPAAIIELGFLGGDRGALDRLRYEMALGIANGISCFLR